LAANRAVYSVLDPSQALDFQFDKVVSEREFSYIFKFLDLYRKHQTTKHDVQHWRRKHALDVRKTKNFEW